MWQMKMRLLQAQFECRFSCCCSCCCLGLTTAGVTILTTCFPSPRSTATATSTQICLADRIRYNDNADDARNELQLLRLECATILEQLPLPELPGLITLKWPMRFVFVPCTVSGQSGLCGWLRPDLVDRLRFSSLCRFVQSFHGYALRTQRCRLSQLKPTNIKLPPVQL